MTELAGIFRRPFLQQVAAFRLRLQNLVPTAKWDDIWQEQHDRAFMVAGATKADLLSDLALAVDKAIATGTTLEEFRRDFRQIVQDRGWHGWTGEGTEGGEAWRTRVIYQTNMRVSYMGGRHAQLVEGNYAFWIYFHGGSVEPRENHLGWNAIALPPSHPFWAQHYPPNGWGCSCYAIGARSADAVRRRGGDPNKRLPDNWQKIDPKTGAPVGIGKGWAYAPGASVAQTVTALAPKLAQLPARPAIDLIQSWFVENLFGAWFAKPVTNWPMARLSDDLAKSIGAKTPVAVMSPDTAIKQLRRHPELSVFDYGRIQNIVDQASEIIQDGPQSLIFIQEPKEANGHVLVVRTTKSGDGLFVTSFRRLSYDQGPKERELARLRNKEGR